MNVYDFDNTIYSGDSTADFIFWCIKKNPFLSLKFLPGAAAFGGYMLKQCNKTYFKEKLYRFLSAVPNPVQSAEMFWEEYDENIKDWYLDQKKEDDVIISASPEFLLKPICKKLGIKYLIASRVDPSTGMYLGENCYGEEKVRRFKKQFDTTPEEFYSDSLSDAPMANIAEKAFLVDDDILIPWEG